MDIMDKLQILFATDFSSTSKNALYVLKLFKEKYRLDVSFIHVVSSFWKNWFTSGLYQKEAQQRLQSWQKELIGKTDLEKLYVELGNPADSILSAASTLKINLIVLGGKETQVTGRYKSGTTIETVARNAKQSVLIAKSKKLTKILCGIDGSAFSAKALNQAIELSKQFGAKLSIIFVLPKVNFDALGMEKNEIKQEEDEFKKENTKMIDKFIEEFDFLGIEVNKHIAWGIPSHVILDMAEDFAYDMIVIGVKGHSLLSHVLVGSTAEKILRFAPCSLFVVR